LDNSFDHKVVAQQLNTSPLHASGTYRKNWKIMNKLFDSYICRPNNVTNPL